MTFAKRLREGVKHGEIRCKRADLGESWETIRTASSIVIPGGMLLNRNSDPSGSSIHVPTRIPPSPPGRGMELTTSIRDHADARPLRAQTRDQCLGQASWNSSRLLNHWRDSMPLTCLRHGSGSRQASLHYWYKMGIVRCTRYGHVGKAAIDEPWVGVCIDVHQDTLRCKALRTV
jgi:hypothetical protein